MLRSTELCGVPRSYAEIGGRSSYVNEMSRRKQGTRMCPLLLIAVQLIVQRILCTTLLEFSFRRFS